MSYDYRKLKGKIVEVFGTQTEFAKQLGIGRTTLNSKLNNLTEFTQKEIQKACELLGINKEEISVYFFTVEVQKHEHIA